MRPCLLQVVQLSRTRTRGSPVEMWFTRVEETRILDIVDLLEAALFAFELCMHRLS